VRERDTSLVRSVVGWGRLTGAALTTVAAILAALLVLERDLRVEVNASARYGRPLALLMIDVDHFKSYNDTFGHQAGDAALQSVARVLATGLRASDVAYRYGGEEFVLILRETTRSDAVVLAERVRSAIEHHFAAPSHPRAITISIGVAGLPEHGPSGDTLTHAADEALYEAKSAGRNRVVVAAAASHVTAAAPPPVLRAAQPPDRR
jgi:diguanylate cyclase (GGDEF)-like protein